MTLFYSVRCWSVHSDFIRLYFVQSEHLLLFFSHMFYILWNVWGQRPYTRHRNLNNWTWCTSNFWSSRSLVDLRVSVIWPQSHLFLFLNKPFPSHVFQLSVSLVSPKMKRHNSTNFFIKFHFTTKMKWNEMKFRHSSSRKLWNEINWNVWSTVGGELKWSENLVFHENFMKISWRKSVPLKKWHPCHFWGLPSFFLYFLSFEVSSFFFSFCFKLVVSFLKTSSSETRLK